MDIKRIRKAREILHRLENRGILENNLSAEQITAIRTAEFALDELCKSKGVQPVKRGRWIEVSSKHSRCSVCDTTCLIAVYPISKGANYCPNCGARMSGDTE